MSKSREADAFLVTVSEVEIRRERSKARVLRSSPWWKKRRDQGLCYYCQGKFPPGELTMDHLVPIIRGGKSVKGNVVPSCRKCNAEKKYRLSMDWRPG